MGLNVEKIRQDFPVLQKMIHNKPIIYFDNACMTMRPVQVIEKIKEYYMEYPACGDRSLHKLGKRVDEEVSKAKELVKKFINAKDAKELILTKNTTEGINLVANSLALKPGDVVLGTDKEHNSNLLPWQRLAPKGVVYDYAESDEDGSFSLDNFRRKLNKKVRLVAMVMSSNMDGTSIPAKEIVKIAHDNGSLVLFDGAQAVPHHEVDMRKLDVDFLAFSGHKMMGPTGTGILYGKQHLLEELSPFLVGGGTVIDSTHTTAKYEEAPHKFEAGLQDYAGIIGLGEAANYIMKTGRDNIEKQETMLNKVVTAELADMVSILGPKDAAKRSGIFSFNAGSADPHEIAMMLDQMENICVRSGAHCVHSWFNAHNMRGSVRASFYLYNTPEECRKFVDTLKMVMKIVK